MFLISGTLIHISLGIGMRLAFGWRVGIVATIFASKEFGELKYKLPGSVTTLDKNIAMFSELFFNLTIVSQWLLPALAAWAVSLYLIRKNHTTKLPG